jgi:outer membrane protein
MYSRIRGTVALATAIIVFGTFAPGAMAAKLEPAVIAFLDSQKILRQSVAAESIRKQIDGYRSAYGVDIAASEKKLREEREELKRQRPLLSADVFAAKLRKFEDSVAKVQRVVQERTRMLDRSFNTSMRVVDGAIRKIVSELTAEWGFNIVVERRQILFARRDLDITKAVLEKLNVTLPDVKVPPPTEAPAKK